MRSRGGALHSRPDHKMGHHFELPSTWYITVAQARASSSRAGGYVKVMKKHANKKRRQRDRLEARG